jgi:hypothetical protein
VSPLLQRLAVERLAAPGVLDRSRIHRLHDRLSSPPRTRILDRLQRRAIPGTPSAEGLYLARAARSTAASTSGLAGGEESIPVRRAPGVLQTNDFVAKLSPTVDRSGGRTAIARATAPTNSGIGVLQCKPANGSASASIATHRSAVESMAKSVDGFHVTLTAESQRATENANSSETVADGVPAAARSSSTSEHLTPAKPIIPTLWRKIDAAPVGGTQSAVQHQPTRSGRLAFADPARYGSDLPIVDGQRAGAIVSRRRDRSPDGPTYRADPIAQVTATPFAGHTHAPGATDKTGTGVRQTSDSATAAASPVGARAQSGRPSSDLILRKSLPPVTSPQAASRSQTTAFGSAPAEVRSSSPALLWRKADSAAATANSSPAATVSQAIAPAPNAVCSPPLQSQSGTAPGHRHRLGDRAGR